MDTSYYYLNKDSEIKDYKAPSKGGDPVNARVAIVNKVMSRPGGAKTISRPLTSHTSIGLRFAGNTRMAKLSNKQQMIPTGYDFQEIDRIVHVESWVLRAFYNLTSLVLNNNGYHFESHNDAARKYVERRLKELTFAINGTGSIPLFMRKLVENVVKKSNAIVYMHRERGGEKYKFANEERNKIKGIEIVDPSQINLIKNTESGQIVGYYLSVPENDKKLPLKHTHLIRYHQVSQDNWFGCPMIEPVKDDILELRRMEEMLSLAMGKVTFPLYHVAVGDEKGLHAPVVYGPNGNANEVEYAKREWEAMAPEGALITPGHYKVQVVQPRSVADFKPYLEWFRERVFTGLMMDGPSMGIGDTANRDTSNNMSNNLINKVKDIQCHIADQLNAGLIREILQESDRFNPVGEDEVYLVWDEVDIETLMKKENHVMAIFQSSLLTFDEARKLMGMDPMTTDQINKDTYQPYLAKFQALVKNAGQQNSTASQNRPTNQHGTRSSSATKRTRRDSLTPALNKMRNQLAIHHGSSGFQPIIDTEFRLVQDRVASILRRELPTISKAEISNIVDKGIEEIKNHLIEQLNTDQDVYSAFESNEWRFGHLIDSTVEKLKAKNVHSGHSKA